MVQRSFIVPVLSMGDGERLNILGLLRDLEAIDGEVICIFNSDEVFERLRCHPRAHRHQHGQVLYPQGDLHS